MVIALTFIIVIALRLEVRGIVNAVTDRLLPHITGTMLTERFTAERFAHVNKEVEEIKTDLKLLKEDVRKDIARIKGHLEGLPAHLRLPPEGS